MKHFNLHLLDCKNINDFFLSIIVLKIFLGCRKNYSIKVKLKILTSKLRDAL